MARPITIRFERFGAIGIYDRLSRAVYKEVIKVLKNHPELSKRDGFNIVAAINKVVLKQFYYPGKY